MSDEERSPSAQKILVVDDNDDFRWLTGNLLEGAGYSVIQAQDGEEALKLLEKDVPDLILLDHRMPGRNGLEVAADVKQQIPTMPIIMITAYAEVESAVKAMKMGMYDYVTKPIEKEGLLITIKRVLEKHDLEQQVKELRKSLRALERLITSLSTRFINLASNEIDSGIEQALEVIGKFLNIDRSYVFVFSDDETKMSCLYEWCADGIRPRIQDLQEFPTNSLSWFMEFMRRHEAFHVPCVDDMPAKAKAEKEHLQEQGIQSILCVPMIFGGSLVGFVGFDSVRERKTWTETEEIISLVKIACQMFVNSLKRKRSEEALSRSEEKYRTILESTEEGYYEVDIAGNLTFFNQSMCKILGYPKDEMTGMNIRQYTDKENAKNMYRTFEEVYATGESAKGFDLEIMRKDKTKRNVEASVSLMKDREGQPIGFRGILRDISERVKAKEELRASEARFKMLFEFAPDAYYLTDMNGNFIDGNKSAERLVGYDREELIGRNFFEVGILAQDQTPKAAELFAKNGQGEARGPDELILNRKDGGQVHVEITTLPIRIKDQDVVLGLARDVTERKKAQEEKKRLEDQLQQAQKMEALGTLAGGIAHDFNNILGIANIYAEMGLLDLSRDDPLRQNLERIVKAVRRAKDLVKQILTFSREKEQTKMVVDVVPLIKEGVKLLRPSLPSTIQIQQSITIRTGLIEADPTQIHQVLMNLCTNAAQAMQEEGREGQGGVLTISLDDAVVDENTRVTTLRHNLSPGPHLKLTVSDTGVGIDRDALERIFEPYFTTKHPGEGTGLGLSVVHGIVQNHGAAIDVRSEPGKGTTFEVFFPKTAREIQEWLPSESSPVTLESYPARTERILFVDDEGELVQGISETLAGLGYNVVSKTDSLEALDTFAAQPEDFDLVITDQTMPKMTGAKLANEILSIRADIPIILCTGHSKAITEAQARAMGIRAFLMKPISIGNLTKTIRRVLAE
ncbi:MAG: PAS domain S-box protein [Pseudomonadota bacterium]